MSRRRSRFHAVLTVDDSCRSGVTSSGTVGPALMGPSCAGLDRGDSGQRHVRIAGAVESATLQAVMECLLRHGSDRTTGEHADMDRGWRDRLAAWFHWAERTGKDSAGTGSALRPCLCVSRATGRFDRAALVRLRQKCSICRWWFEQWISSSRSRASCVRPMSMSNSLWFFLYGWSAGSFVASSSSRP
jgi:hypothetical protein